MYHPDVNINAAVERSADQMLAVRGRGARSSGGQVSGPLAGEDAGGRQLGAQVAGLVLAAGLIGSVVLALAASF